jgi:AbrB family looped-hinge helix DNA binding protein
MFYDIDIDMETVTLSSKFQIVIPKAVRERMKLKPGTKFRVIDVGGTVEMIPIRPVREMRGRFKDVDTNIEREDDRL